MPVTPEQARAELARRQAVKPPVTPEQARAELARRQAAEQAPPTLPAHLQRPRSVPTTQGLADLRNASLPPPQQTGLQRLRGLVGGDAPRAAPDSTPVYTTPERLRPMVGGVPVGEAIAGAVTRTVGEMPASASELADSALYTAQRGVGGVQNIGEGIVAGGLSLGRGMGIDSLPSPQFISDMREERQLGEPPNPVAGYTGDAAELVGTLGPIMFGGVPGMVAGAGMGAGEAAMQGKSGGGQVFNAALNALPGMRFRVPGLGQASGQVVGGAATNAAIPLLTATETTLFEDNPELAQQELDQVLPEGATGLTLETAVQLASRGRAPRLSPRLQHGAPTQAYAPIAPAAPSPTNFIVPEGIPSYSAEAPAPVPPRDAPYAVTPEVIQAVRDNPQVTTSVRDIAENLAADTPDAGPSTQQAMAAEAAKKAQLNLAGDEAVQAAADRARGEQSIRQADDAALRQQEIAQVVDNALGEKPRGLTETSGRPPDAAPRDVEKARFEGGQRTAEQLKAQFQADLKDITRQRNEGLIGKPQAAALRDAAKARYDAALAPQITKAADTAEVVARAGEVSPPPETAPTPAQAKTAPPVAPSPRAVEPPPPSTPDYAPAAQKLPAPVAPPAPNQKVLNLPGYQHLSPEARTYLASLKPGQRSALKEAVADLKKTPTDNDKAHLSRSLNRIEGLAGRAPLDAANGEKLPPPPPRTPPPAKPPTAPPPPPTPEPKAPKRHGAISRFTGLVHERMWKTLAKKPGGEKVARMAQGVLDRSMELRAKVSTTAYKALKALPKDARKSFAQERTEGQFIYSRIHDVLEQRSAPRPEEQKFFDLLKKLYYDTGLQKQLANMKIRTKAGLIPFTADKDRLSAPRQYTEDFLRMAEQPNSPDTQDFIKNLAEANPDVGIERIRKEIADFADSKLTRRGMAEDSRVIKNLPTAFRTKDGRVIQIQSADPSEMVKALSDRTTARTAFVESFGQDEVPKAFLELMGDNSSPEVRDAAHELFRTLNHLELKDPGKDKFSGLVAPSGKAAKILQLLGSAWSARKLGALSTAGIANAPELMGKPAIIAGRRNIAKALKTFLSTRGEKRNALMEQLESEGAITRTLLDNYWNKNDKTETLTRYMNNLGHLPVHVLNEAHEAITAMAMKLRVERIREGKGGAMDRLMLMDLDFTPQEIKDLLRGGFTDRDAQKITRRAVEWALSSTSQPAEVSRLQNSNAWKFATVASKFSSANFNRNFHTVVNALRSLSPESGVSWDNQVKHVLQAVAPATLHVGNAVVNQTAAAGTAMIIRSLLAGGASVLADRATGSSLGAEDFIKDALANSFLQGTLQSFASVFVDDPYDRSIIEKVADTTILSGTAQDVFNFATGKGKYQELSAGERTKEFLRGNVSASPIIMNTAHVLGMKQMKPETTAAIKAAMEWRKRYMPAGGGSGETTEFSAARRQAERDIEAGRDPTANLNKALGAKDGKTLATSLRGRRILDDLEPKKTDSEEKKEEKEKQLKAMEKYLGPRTMARIREYDSMLDDWAEDVRPLKQGDQVE